MDTFVSKLEFGNIGTAKAEEEQNKSDEMDVGEGDDEEEDDVSKLESQGATCWWERSEWEHDKGSPVAEENVQHGAASDPYLGARLRNRRNGVQPSQIAEDQGPGILYDPDACSIATTSEGVRMPPLQEGLGFRSIQPEHDEDEEFREILESYDEDDDDVNCKELKTQLENITETSLFAVVVPTLEESRNYYDRMSNPKACCSCYISEKDVVVLPCGHCYACRGCFHRFFMPVRRRRDEEEARPVRCFVCGKECTSHMFL